MVALVLEACSLKFGCLWLLAIAVCMMLLRRVGCIDSLDFKGVVLYLI